MRETTWKKASKPTGLIKAIAQQGSQHDRKLRLFACACVRVHWGWVKDEKDRHAVDLAEKGADGLASVKEMEANRDKRVWHRGKFSPHWTGFVAEAAQACLGRPENSGHVRMSLAASYCESEARRFSSAQWREESLARKLAKEVEQRRQISILHDLFGDPFVSVPLNARALTWDGGRVAELAREIYEARSFERMPELAHLLEKAGWNDDVMLNHCRNAGSHFRGCWVVDLLLGKHVPFDPTPVAPARISSPNDDQLLPYESYVVLWSQSRCDALERLGQIGSRPDVLFGGPHTSEPRLSRFHVKPGDRIFAIRVEKGVVYLIANMRVRQIESLDSMAQDATFFDGCNLTKQPYEILKDWLALHPEKCYLAPTCTDEVALVEDSTPLRLDLAIPADLLQRLVFKAGKKESKLKNIVNGKLKSSNPVQGMYRRLTKQSARELESLLHENAP